MIFFEIIVIMLQTWIPAFAGMTELHHKQKTSCFHEVLYYIDEYIEVLEMYVLIIQRFCSIETFDLTSVRSNYSTLPLHQQFLRFHW